MAILIEMWELCGTPLPHETGWVVDDNNKGCRLDAGHEDRHLIEYQPRTATELPNKFSYRVWFGGL